MRNHSVLLERRKFRTLGLNIPYDFNDTDFSVSDDLLKSYLDSYEQVGRGGLYSCERIGCMHVEGRCPSS